MKRTAAQQSAPGFPAKADPTSETDVPEQAEGAETSGAAGADEDVPDDIPPEPANVNGMPAYPGNRWPTCLYHPEEGNPMRVVSTPAEWRSAAQAGYLPPEKLPGTIKEKRAILARG